MKKRISTSTFFIIIILILLLNLMKLSWGFNQQYSPELLNRKLHLGMTPKEVETELNLPNNYIKKKFYNFTLYPNIKVYRMRLTEPGFGCLFYRQHEIWLTFDLNEYLINAGGKYYFRSEEYGCSVYLK